MQIFKTVTTKKQIELNLEHANDIYRCLQAYLVPASNIYWCHTLEDHNPNENESNLLLLEKGFPEFVLNLRILKDLYFTTEKICVDNPKMYPFINSCFIKYFKLLNSQIGSTIRKIKEIKLYQNYLPLNKTLQILCKANISVNKKLTDLLEFQKENELIYNNFN